MRDMSHHDFKAGATAWIKLADGEFKEIKLADGDQTSDEALFIVFYKTYDQKGLIMENAVNTSVFKTKPMNREEMSRIINEMVLIN